MVAQKCENEVFAIEYREGYACSGEDQCFYIRRLLALALRRLNEKPAKRENASEKKAEQPAAAQAQPEQKPVVVLAKPRRINRIRRQNRTKQS